MFTRRAERNSELRSTELQNEVAERFGGGLELMNLKHGIFDDSSISMISQSTIACIGRECDMELDRRRFRANIVLETVSLEPFLEDGWVGGTIVFGDSEPCPAVNVTARDVRCMMINLDPDTGMQDAQVMKAVVGLNNNNAGIYGTVVQTGLIHVDQQVRLIRNSRN